LNEGKLQRRDSRYGLTLRYRLFFNDKDELRQIKKPDERFEYKVFKSQRLNDRRREAVVGTSIQIPMFLR